MMLDIHNVFVTFCIILLTYSVYKRLWRKSISTFLFIIAGGVLAIDEINYDIKLIIISSLLFLAILRAITKPENEKFIYLKE